MLDGIVISWCKLYTCLRRASSSGLSSDRSEYERSFGESRVIGGVVHLMINTESSNKGHLTPWLEQVINSSLFVAPCVGVLYIQISSVTMRSAYKKNFISWNNLQSSCRTTRKNNTVVGPLFEISKRGPLFIAQLPLDLSSWKKSCRYIHMSEIYCRIFRVRGWSPQLKLHKN